MLSIAATQSNDLLVVRSLLTARAFSLFAYHSMFPQPVIVRVAWTVLLGVLDARMLYLVARDRDALGLMRLSPEDEEIYERSFRPFGFTRVQFHDLLQKAVRRTYEPGEVVFAQGTVLTEISMTLSGSYNLLLDGQAVYTHVDGHLQMWLGELWDARWDSSVVHYHNRGLVATSRVETLTWDKHWLHDHLNSDPTKCLQVAAANGQLKQLWMKYSMSQQRFREATQLRVALDAENEALREENAALRRRLRD